MGVCLARYSTSKSKDFRYATSKAEACRFATAKSKDLGSEGDVTANALRAVGLPTSATPPTPTSLCSPPFPL